MSCVNRDVWKWKYDKYWHRVRQCYWYQILHAILFLLLVYVCQHWATPKIKNVNTFGFACSAITTPILSDVCPRHIFVRDSVIANNVRDFILRAVIIQWSHCSHCVFFFFFSISGRFWSSRTHHRWKWWRWRPVGSKFREIKLTRGYLGHQ